MKFYKIILVLTVFLFVGCSTIEVVYPQHNPTEARVIGTLDVDYKIDKAVYSKNSKTIFVMGQNKIYIYRDNKPVNTIGYLGSSQINFIKLSDICLSSDGNLLALDSFRKIIYKYDISGSLISEIKISEIGNPLLLAMAADEKIYIYDNAAKEIVVLDLLEQSDFFTFGKFSLKNPTHLSTYKNNIYIYDNMVDVTSVFNSFGQQEKEYTGFHFFDQFQDFSLGKYYFVHSDSSQKFHITPNEIENCFVSDSHIIIIHKFKIIIFQMKYERKK